MSALLEPTRTELLDELRNGEKYLLVTHERPDGDALGSLIAMRELLREFGKDAAVFIDREEFPLPPEYAFLDLDEGVCGLPEDVDERAVIYLDCGNVDRNAFAAEAGAHILNIDHHHDNTRFGTVNVVVPEASCTAEIVWDLARSLGVEPGPAMAEALYVGLITDTGRFMYSNTTVRAHEMAADLLAGGVDAFAVYRRIYEGVPPAKLALLARGLRRLERYDGGALTVTQLCAEDFADTSAEESYSEGVIDHLRALEGTLVAGLVRDRLDAPGQRKVSLRSSDDRVDVSRIARAQGGGGHPQAAGFTTSLPWDELVGFLRDAVAEQLA